MRLTAALVTAASVFVLFSATVAPADRPSLAGLAGLGRSCVSGDPGHLCLGLKYVVYRSGDGAPVADEAAALANLRTMNRVWSQCGISFQLEQFSEVDPKSYGLKFNPSNLSEMDSIRSAFADSSRLLFVTTGIWDRKGTLGDSPANAWTAMPAAAPFGSVMEATVSKYSMIYSHEMGHYLNLDHVQGSDELMNPVIYLRSTQIDPDECETARTAAQTYWSHALRS